MYGNAQFACMIMVKTIKMEIVYCFRLYSHLVHLTTWKNLTQSSVELLINATAEALRRSISEPEVVLTGYLVFFLTLIFSYKSNLVQ